MSRGPRALVFDFDGVIADDEPLHLAAFQRTLAAEGIELEVLDLRSLVPLDEEAVLETVKKTGKVILLHEDTRTGGLAGELAARIGEKAFDHLDGPLIAGVPSGLDRIEEDDAETPRAGAAGIGHAQDEHGQDRRTG